MAEKTSDASDLADQIKTLQGELASLTDAFRTYSKAQAKAGAETVREAANEAGERLRGGAEEARRRGERLAHDLEGQITGNPLPAVLIAAGIGLVIGTMLGRR